MKTLVAVVFSVLLIGYIGADVSAQRPVPRDRGVMFETLGLTPEQKAKLKMLLRGNRDEAHKAQQALMEERMRLFATYDDYQLNASRARQTMAKMNRLQLDLLNASLGREIALRRVLTADQFGRMKRNMGPDPFGRQRWGGPRGMEPREGGRRLPQLGLSPDQQGAVEEFWKSHDKRVRESGRAMERDLVAVKRLYENYRLDEGAAKRLISNVNKAQAHERQLRLDWQVEMRKILSQDQFRALTQHIKKSFGPPRGFGPRPHRAPR